MEKNISISLGGHFENFVQKEVQSGRYKSVSEVIRTALKLLENEEKKELELLRELQKGERSKTITDFDPEKNLEKLHKKHL